MITEREIAPGYVEARLHHLFYQRYTGYQAFCKTWAALPNANIIGYSQFWEMVEYDDGQNATMLNEICMLLIARRLGMKALEVTSQFDDDPPQTTRNLRYVWNGLESSQIFLHTVDPWKHLPLWAYNTDAALRLPMTRVSIVRNPTGSMWSLWTATIDGQEASQNSPALAICKAWMLKHMIDPQWWKIEEYSDGA